MKNILSTWICLDVESNSSYFPSAKGFSSDKKTQDIYWRCLVSCMFTARKFNPSLTLVIFSNTDKLPFIDGVDLSLIFKTLNMNQYFFKMSQAEKNNILDQHKTIYDGYVTQFGQQSNTQPLYVQDYANDKAGLVVSNKGNVKSYTNIGINESHSMLDGIADGPLDLENGTVDFDDVENEDDDYRFFSAGVSDDEDDDFSFHSFEIDEEEMDMDTEEEDIDMDTEEDGEDMDIDFDEKMSIDLVDEVPEDLKENFIKKLDESLSMFKRIIK
jgi:hypothetical protein